MEQRRPAQLSGGQQQRVALARALATNPEVLLLDEPLSALDAKLRQELRVELKEILSQVGTTTIVVTHDQEEAMSLADQVLIIDHGRIMQRGAPAEIYARPANRFVAEFVGRSNWFLGRLGDAAGSLRQMVTDDGLVLRIRAPKQVSDAGVEVCVRPERMAIAPDAPLGTSAGSETTALPGTVVDAALLGAWVHCIVETASRRRLLVIEKNVGLPPRPTGQRVTVCFSPDDCIVLPVDDREPTRTAGWSSPLAALAN